MEMIQECIDDIDPMSHDEALSHAVDHKSSVIVEIAKRADHREHNNVSTSSVHTSDDGSSGEGDSGGNDSFRDKNKSTKRMRKIEASFPSIHHNIRAYNKDVKI